MEQNLDLKNKGTCEIPKAGPSGSVIFGASGNLARRKLFPSFFSIYKTGGLNKDSFIAGAGRTKMSDDEFRVSARKAIMEAGLNPAADELDDFCSRLYYFQLEYDDASEYLELKAGLDGLAVKHKTCGNNVFMLAVPPGLFIPVIEGLGQSGLLNKKDAPYSRVMVEKPFGRDTQSAALINEVMLKYTMEKQIFRVDHYLGKNTVQNIMVFRFANTIFGPVWNKDYVDSVQINFFETNGVGGRAGYFEQAGLIRDMLQNHLLQLMTLVAMEKPVSLSADALQDEKVKVLRAVKPVDTDNLSDSMIRGQYGPGKSFGSDVPAYRDEQSVNPKSCIETFFAARLFIDNERWTGVPFYIKAGKRLNRSSTAIHVVFKDDPDCLFCKSGIQHGKDILTFEIHPNQGVRVKFNAKAPGSKMCLSLLDMDFNYNKIFGMADAGGYENIILDCMLGDQTLFWRRDAIEESWKILTPVLRKWEACSISEKSKMMFSYEAGSSGPKEADEFISRDGRTWVE